MIKGPPKLNLIMNFFEEQQRGACSPVKVQDLPRVPGALSAVVHTRVAESRRAPLFTEPQPLVASSERKPSPLNRSARQTKSGLWFESKLPLSARASVATAERKSSSGKARTYQSLRRVLNVVGGATSVQTAVPGETDILLGGSNAAVAQLVEHRLCKSAVQGSIPCFSSKKGVTIEGLDARISERRSACANGANSLRSMLASSRSAVPAGASASSTSVDGLTGTPAAVVAGSRARNSFDVAGDGSLIVPAESVRRDQQANVNCERQQQRCCEHRNASGCGLKRVDARGARVSRRRQHTSIPVSAPRSAARVTNAVVEAPSPGASMPVLKTGYARERGVSLIVADRGSTPRASTTLAEIQTCRMF